jgi:glycosyltransferase involved in cell wall biosynthesis
MSSGTDQRISIILPARDESRNLEPLLYKIKNLFPQSEILVVDDGSADQTTNVAGESASVVLSHPYTMGNGAAIKSGIRVAAGDTLVFMDGDGQHDPEDIRFLLEHLDRYDMVVGARTKDQHASMFRRVMNRLFNRLASYVTGFAVEDLTSGFRAMRAETARDLLPLLPNGYSWPTTSTLVLLRSGLSVKYVPVNVRPRKHGRSRIRPVHDGIRFFMIIMKICTLYSPFRIFLPVSGAMFLLGLVNYAYTYFTAGRFTNMSALMFTSAVIIFMMGLVSEQVSQIGLLKQQVRGRVKAAEPDDGRAGEPAGRDDEQP